MTFKKDFNELLLYLLRELVKNALHFEEIVSGSASGRSHIDVKVEDLRSKVSYATRSECFFAALYTLLLILVSTMLYRHRNTRSTI